MTVVLGWRERKYAEGMIDKGQADAIITKEEKGADAS